ncbi:MAG: POTRA domain-containing protein, partial [Candidatus Babeliales bacterium]|nr:POTRA domain-containing protein [Candidatus Babeliales bacterium]
MNQFRKNLYKPCILLTFLSGTLCWPLVIEAQDAPQTHEESTEQPINDQQADIPSPKNYKKIHAIHVMGNKYVTTQAIINYLPFKVGELFDSRKNKIIKNIYLGLNRFNDIKVYAKDIDDQLVDVYIIVKEKKLLKDVVFEGNKAVSDKDIKTKINFTDIPALDEEELKKYAQEIRKIYLDKSYHLVEITPEFVVDG